VTEALPDRRHVVTSVMEHPAVVAPCSWLETHGWRVTRAGVDEDGRVRAQSVGSSIGPDTALVTIMHANNETGVLQPIAEIAAAARAAGAIMHTDAAQSVGKIPIHVRELGIHLLSLVGHKLYAPKGVGALYVRGGTPLLPFALGAGHERGLRPGTENVASIVGLGAACERARLDLDVESERVRGLRDLLWERLKGQIPRLAMNGHPVERLPNTLSVLFPDVSGIALLAETPGLAASTGSACHAGEEQAPQVIVAMGVPPRDALGTVRLTLGRGSTAEQVLRAAKVLSEAWHALSRGRPKAEGAGGPQAGDSW
jgi:cysteine desulfurase